MLGGWIDQSLNMNGRWHFRSSSTDASYPNNWSSRGEYANGMITNGHNSEGFAQLIMILVLGCLE